MAYIEYGHAAAVVGKVVIPYVCRYVRLRSCRPGFAYKFASGASA